MDSVGRNHGFSDLALPQLQPEYHEGVHPTGRVLEV
jgi:hypothetical protein